VKVTNRRGCPVIVSGTPLPPRQPGGQELEAVGLVGGRAGGADRGPAVAAGLEEGGVGLPVGRVHGADLARGGVGVVDGAVQPHRVGAVAGGRDLFGPAVIAGTGPGDGLSHHLRHDLTHPHWLGHVGLPCVWPAPEVGMVAAEDPPRGEEVKGSCLSGSPTGLGGWWCSPRRRLGSSTTTTSAPSTCCWAWFTSVRAWPPRPWSRWASRWRPSGPRWRRSSARVRAPPPGTSPSPRGPRRSWSCPCARPSSSGTTTSAPSTSCSA